MSTWATAWAWQQKVKLSGERLVLLAIADFADEFAVAFPSQLTIAKMTCQGKRTVERHMEALEVAGLIQRERRRRKDGTRTSDFVRLAGGQKPADWEVAAKQAGDKSHAHETAAAQVAKMATSEETKSPISTELAANLAGASRQNGEGSCQGSFQGSIHSSEVTPNRRRRPATAREGRFYESEERRMEDVAAGPQRFAEILNAMEKRGHSRG